VGKRGSKKRLRGGGLNVSLTGRLTLETNRTVIEEERFGGRQSRLVFAYLVLEEGRPVPREELADALWGETPPATWEKGLTVIVSRLRALLTECGLDGPKLLTSAFGCYRLDLPARTWVDMVAAANSVQEAERALEQGDLAHVQARAGEAAAVARRRFLPAEEGPWVDERRRELTSVLSSAVECLGAVLLRSGHPAEAARYAEEAVTLEPFRESGYRLLMETHTASGNRAEALRVYERCRRLLDDELGAYPSPETQAIHRELLGATDAGPKLAPGAPRPTADLAGRFGRRKLLWGAAALGLAAAAAIVVSLESSASTPVAVPPNSVAVIDPRTNGIEAVVPVGARPGPIATGSGALWVTNLDDGTVSRISPVQRRLVRSIPVGDGTAGLATSRDAVWTIGSSPNAEFASVRRIDPRFDSVGGPVRVRGSTLGGSAAGLATTDAALWAITGSPGVVSRIDTSSGRVTGTFETSTRAAPQRASPTISAAGGTLWVADAFADTVTRIDPPHGITAVASVGHGPLGVAAGLGGVWVPVSLDDKVIEIDPFTNAITRTIRVGRFPVGVVTGFGSVWVANSRDGTISRIDPIAGRVVATVHVGGSPQRLAVAAGRLWVTVQGDVFASGGGAPGGIARVTARTDPGTLDPALAWTPLALQLEYATCAKLVNYADQGGAAGAKVVPDVARTLPAVSADGLTYTFALRSDFRFSPPSNEQVTAETFRYSIERSLDPRMRGSAGSGRAAALVTADLDDVVGARAFERGLAAHIAGITARGNTLRIRLVRPSGDLLARLATPYYCAVPLGTPVRPTGVETVPAAGPYYVAVYAPGVRVVLRRNPGYQGPRPHRLEVIDLAIGVPPARAARDVESGAADYVADGLTTADATRLAARYGPGRPGAPRYSAHPAPAVAYLAFNTGHGIFTDTRLRRAVSFAIDRTALAKAGDAFGFPSVANDHYLPPGMPGFRDLPLYPPRAAVDRARRLGGDRSRAAVLYLYAGALGDKVAQIVRDNLRPLGIRLIVKTFPIVELNRRIGRKDEPFDLATGGWIADYYDPSAILNSQLDPASIGAPENLDISHFTDSAYRRRLEAAERLSGPLREPAYAKLALDLARNAVPWVTISTQVQQDFVSARIGCVVYQPMYRLDLATLCIRR
jgi:SARP family transcriptional regulator, regulator of embCAB operon